MKKANGLEELAGEKKIGDTKIDIDTSINNFIEIIRKDKNIIGKKYLTKGFYLSLMLLGRHVDTIGDLKKLAEKADGFKRLKGGIVYNNGIERKIPHADMRLFGKKKLEYLNEILSDHEIEPIPWISRKYHSWERQEEKGWDWWNRIIKI